MREAKEFLSEQRNKKIALKDLDYRDHIKKIRLLDPNK
jgi:hypothetical protein